MSCPRPARTKGARAARLATPSAARTRTSARADERTSTYTPSSSLECPPGRRSRDVREHRACCRLVRKEEAAVRTAVVAPQPGRAALWGAHPRCRRYDRVEHAVSDPGEPGSGSRNAAGARLAEPASARSGRVGTPPARTHRAL